MEQSLDGTDGMVFSTVILRFSGEIGIKGEATRRIWEKQVVGHLSNRLNQRIDWNMGRAFLRLNAERKLGAIVSTLRRSFGLSSFSPAISTNLTLEDMKKNAAKLVEYYIQRENISTFGIRVDTNLSKIDSMKIKNEVGAYIEDKFDLGVYLDDPDLPLNFDIRREEGFVYVERYEGAGGLPGRVQGRVISLLSGGPDSTLAMFLAAKRGCEIIPVFFDFGKEELRKKARAQAKEVAELLFTRWLPYKGRMYIIPFAEVVNRVIERGRLKYAHLHLRRYMFRTAAILAQRKGAKAIVTGEVIGEKSSQTLRNLFVTSAAVTDFPLLRPLAGKDKEEIFTELAKVDESLRNATNSSVEPCKILTSTPPSTRADLEKVKSFEEKIGITDAELKEIIEASEIISF